MSEDEYLKRYADVIEVERRQDGSIKAVSLNFRKLDELRSRCDQLEKDLDAEKMRARVERNDLVARCEQLEKERDELKRRCSQLKAQIARSSDGFKAFQELYEVIVGLEAALAVLADKDRWSVDRCDPLVWVSETQESVTPWVFASNALQKEEQ